MGLAVDWMYFFLERVNKFLFFTHTSRTAYCCPQIVNFIVQLLTTLMIFGCFKNVKCFTIDEIVLYLLLMI